MNILGGQNTESVKVANNRFFTKQCNFHSFFLFQNLCLFFSCSRTPQIDRSSKPMSLLCDKTGGLRTVVVPEELLAKFMSLADSNTSKNIETCGVLAGKLVSFIPRR